METKRPDGGWGWVVAIAAFVFNFIADGSKYSFGIMFMELLDAFHRSKSVTSWIISIQVAMIYASAPIAGALVNRYGCRVVAVLGTMIGFVGFVVSPFANSVYYLYATYGIVVGIGFGLTNLPLGVSVVRHFDKHLAFACGISAMGSGAGMLLIGPLSKILIDEYTWRGTLLIEAALLLNGLLCAAVLRPIPERPKLELEVQLEDCGIALQDKSNNDFQDLSTNEKVAESDSLLMYYKPSDIFRLSTDSLKENITNTYLEKSFELEARHNINSSNGISIGEKDTENVIAYMNDVSHVQVSDKGNLNDELCEEDHAGLKTESATRWFTLSPLKDSRFLLLLGSSILVEISLMVPFTFLPDMMSQAGYTRKDSVFMLFLIGLLSTGARLITGFVADLKFVNRVMLCYSDIIVNGILTVLCPFCFNYGSYVAFAVLFGFASGSSACLRAVLLPDLFGIDMIADRMGILNFFCGFAALVGLPITGAIYDVSGSYVIPFLVAGIELIISGVLVFLITLLNKKL